MLILLDAPLSLISRKFAVIISIIHALKEARPINTTASLVAYVICGGLGGQIANLVGTRIRWWVMLSCFLQVRSPRLQTVDAPSHPPCRQVILLAVPTGLVFRHVLDPDVQNDQWILLLLLAASSGFQIAIARTCGVGEIPTAMLSTPIVSSAFRLEQLLPAHAPANHRPT